VQCCSALRLLRSSEIHDAATRYSLLSASCYWTDRRRAESESYVVTRRACKVISSDALIMDSAEKHWAESGRPRRRRSPTPAAVEDGAWSGTAAQI